MANYIISSTWHTEKWIIPSHDEADKIVTTACKIIQAEIINAVWIVILLRMR